MWSLRLPRLVKFEFPWIQMYLLMPTLGSLTVFFIFFHFSEIERSFSNDFSARIPYCWMNFADGLILLYSIFLGFLMYHWFPPFVTLGTRTNVVSATLVASHFLIFSLYSSFEVSLQKVPSWPSSFGGS